MPKTLDPSVVENASNMCRTASRVLVQLADNLRNPQNVSNPQENDRLLSVALANIHAAEARLK